MGGETAESNNKKHAFDTTVVHGCEMFEKSVNLCKMKSTVMFRSFEVSFPRRGVTLDIEASLDLSQKYRVDENGCNASLLILPVSPFSLYLDLISMKQIMASQMKKEMSTQTLNVGMHQNHFDVGYGCILSGLISEDHHKITFPSSE